MTRSVALAGVAVLGLVGGLAGVPASADGPKQGQLVEGSVELPTINPVGPESCWTYTHRAFTFSDDNQGVFGFDFAVDKKTWKKRFVLKLDDALGSADLDIWFSTDRGDLMSSSPTDPITYVAYERRIPGGEKGRVPAKMNFAVVCIFGGTAAEGEPGARASFTYKAG